MLSGIYSAASALTVAEQNQELIAHNLAHVGVPGFRRSVLSVQSFENAFHSATGAQGHGSAVSTVASDFSPGPIVNTGRKLDVAINGDGFFAVQGDDGPLYTRNGVFQMGPDGQLLTSDGRAVLGTDGPISVPAGTLPSQMNIAADGAIQVNGAQVGQLQLVRFDDTSALVPAGTTLFQAADTAALPGDVAVRQGAREQSNVAAVDELVQMIVNMRLYEASQRALRSIDRAVQQNTDPRG